MENQENKLKCKMSTFKSPLTFNEWASMYNVGSMYKEPTPFFQGNIKPSEVKEETPFQALVNFLLK
jgi:hypothetical protein